MANISILSNSGHTAYGIKEYVCKNRDALADLPVDVPMGCVAIVASDASVFIFDGESWVEA